MSTEDLLIEAETELDEQRTLAALEAKIDALSAAVMALREEIKAIKVPVANQRSIRITVTSRDEQERIKGVDIQ
jgi:outer membrane murein-binding lipoprotein Lpp